MTRCGFAERLWFALWMLRFVGCMQILGVDFEGKARPLLVDDAGASEAGKEEEDEREAGQAVDAGPDRFGGVTDRTWSAWRTELEATPELLDRDTVVVDANSSLSWPRATLDGTYTYADALAACDKLEFAGYTDYRLPTRIELQSMVRYNTPAPKTSRVFMTSEVGFYWTSSRVAEAAELAWTIEFRLGLASRAKVSELGLVRCTRGGRDVANSPADRFSMSGGAIYDNISKRTWQPSTAGPFTASEARGYCRGLSIGGVSGFRAPTLAELSTLVDERQTRPALASLFGVDASNTVWASTPLDSTGFAYAIDFRTGESIAALDGDAHHIRCVQ
jgi:Protein of unknown function (DUF1566)